MSKLILFVATLGPIGRKLPAPGTFGSLTGLVVYWLLVFPGTFEPVIIHSGFGILAFCAIPICGKAEIILGKEDPSEVVLDEFVAQPLVFMGIQWASPVHLFDTRSLLVLACGFALFRFFDILKPLGIGRLQSIPGGTGVVADDIAAALAAGLLLWWIFGTLPIS
jgi:phosphatidylglycerophosphatase A